MALEHQEQSPHSQNAPRSRETKDVSENIREFFAEAKPTLDVDAWRRQGDAFVVHEAFDAAIRAYARANATDKLLDLGDQLLANDGLLFLAEDAYVAAGRPERLADVGDRYVALGNDAGAIDMYAAAGAWGKLAALQARIEGGV